MICHWFRYLRNVVGIMDTELEKQLKTSQAHEVLYLSVKRHLNIYATTINGFECFFMLSNCLHGSRCYYLNNNFAKVLGFSDIQRLREVLRIRKARDFISVDTLRRRINEYSHRSMDLEPLPEWLHKRMRKRKNKKKD